MTDRRMIRDRIVAAQVTGAASALSRRTGRNPKPAAETVEYPGQDTDTPIIDMVKAIKPQIRNFRTGENLHVSDVISKCVRKIAIMRRMDFRHPVETQMDGQAVTFAIGDAVHDFVKAKFAKGHPGKVYAKWTCPCEATEHTGTLASVPEKSCNTCGMAVNVHNEIPFLHKDYKLIGSPDLLLWMNEYGALYLVEIKSISADQFKELARPLPDHKVQLAFYWHLIKGKIPVLDRASILYVNKEFSFKFPYKEFLIDPSEIDLGVFYEDLEALKKADEGGPLPVRTMCGTQQAPEAKKCPVCVTCFGCP